MNIKIQIQHLLKLNSEGTELVISPIKDSNTTLVKVKFAR